MTNPTDGTDEEWDAARKLLDKRLNRGRVAAYKQRQRDAGRIQRTKWAHPDDWPEIDSLIDKLNKRRES